MTEQHEAPRAPATAVEAVAGASPGASAHNHTIESTPPAALASPEGASAAAPSAESANTQPAGGAQGADPGGAQGADPGGAQGADPGGAQGADPGGAQGADAASEEGALEDGDEAHAADEAHASGEAQAAGAEGAATPTDGDPLRKKRRRRRRKKGAPQEQGAAAGQPGAAAEGAAVPERSERPAREGAGGVFARFFEGANSGKRHAFSAGEVVAGRVVRINDGAFVVDLFGKATAFVDIFEPHEVPILVEPPPEPPPPQAAATESPAAGGELPAAPSAGDEDPSAEAAADAAPSAGEAPAVGETLAVGETSAAGPEAVADASAEETLAAAIAVQALGASGAPSAQGAARGSVEQLPAAAPNGELAPSGEVESAFGTSAIAASQPDNAAAPAVAASSEGEPSHAELAAESSEPAQVAARSAEAGEAEHADEGPHEERAAEPEPAPPPPPELGSIFRGRIGSVAESGHVILVNRIIDSAAAKQRVVRAREQRQRVRGVVYGFNRGGFDVLVEGVRVFCPASGMALGAIENPEQLLGQRLEFTVPPAKAGTHGLVVSRRGILERQQRKAAKQLFRSLQPGQRLRGRVTQVREFGLFVDLGGFEGLVHQSELSFSRGVRPQDAAVIGDEIDVQVLRVGEGQTRKERERVSLSLKALQEDPWSAHSELLEPGHVVTGKVVRTTEFGAFIELAPQIEGLLHISELGRELKHANQALDEGQELRVVIERADRKARRISLSRLTQAEEKSVEAGELKSARPPKPGQHLTVVVDKVEHAGLIVQVPGVFGRRGRGFIPNSEMGTERGTDHRRGFPPGTQIPAKVIGVDRDGGFRFSRKALLVEEEKRAVQDYRREAARHGLGTFGDLLRAKLEGTKQES